MFLNDVLRGRPNHLEWRCTVYIAGQARCKFSSLPPIRSRKCGRNKRAVDLSERDHLRLKQTQASCDVVASVIAISEVMSAEPVHIRVVQQLMFFRYISSRFLLLS